MASISSHIDKINLSQGATMLSEVVLPENKFWEIKEKLPRPFTNYHEAYRLMNGAILNISRDEKQGSRLDIGGEALSLMRAVDSDSDFHVLAFFGTANGMKRITRVDYAINVHDDLNASVMSALSEFDAALMQTRIKVVEHDDRHRIGKYGGETAYFGSRWSEQRVVIYDKAAEMALLNKAWLRVELRVTKPKSELFVTDCLDHKIEIAGRSWLMRVLDAPNLKWWQNMLSGDTIAPLETHRKDDRFWLYMSTVLDWIQQRIADPDQYEQAVEFAGRLGWLLANRSKD